MLRDLAAEMQVGGYCALRLGRVPRAWVVMAAEFELYKSGSQYRWRLQAGNNEVIASGEAYTSKAGALKGIDAVT
jgi:uncharacterized protein